LVLAVTWCFHLDFGLYSDRHIFSWLVLAVTWCFHFPHLFIKDEGTICLQNSGKCLHNYTVVPVPTFYQLQKPQSCIQTYTDLITIIW
jgi:hypothetical protein